MNSILFKMSLLILLGWVLQVIARIVLLSNGFKARPLRASFRGAWGASAGDAWDGVFGG